MSPSIGGIEIQNGKALGRDFQLVRPDAQNYDAVFLGMGLGGVNALRAEGEDAEGVENAVEFIADACARLRIWRRCRSAAASSSSAAA